MVAEDVDPLRILQAATAIIATIINALVAEDVDPLRILQEDAMRLQWHHQSKLLRMSIR